MARNLTPILSVTRRDAVLTELRDAILTGALAPGTRLREVHLAKELGVSRPTLREALYQLIHEGLLVQEDFKGIMVASMDRASIQDIAIVRASLETIAAKTIAADEDGASREALRQAWAAYEEAAKNGDPAEENEAHLALHQTIWTESRNSMLRRIWPIVSAPVHLALSADLASQHGDTDRNLRMHRELVDAILSNEPATIETAVHEHIEVSANLLLDALADQERAAAEEEAE